MRTLLPLLLALSLLPLTGPALAGPVLPVEQEACSPYLHFIDPNPPVVCGGAYVGNVNDLCVWAEHVEKCVRYVGPVLA